MELVGQVEVEGTVGLRGETHSYHLLRWDGGRGARCCSHLGPWDPGGLPLPLLSGGWCLQPPQPQWDPVGLALRRLRAQETCNRRDRTASSCHRNACSCPQKGTCVDTGWRKDEGQGNLPTHKPPPNLEGIPKGPSDDLTLLDSRAWACPLGSSQQLMGTLVISSVTSCPKLGDPEPSHPLHLTWLVWAGVTQA